MIGLELVDIKGMRLIFEQARDEFYVALVTAAAVVLVGVEQAILLAIVLSLIEHLRRGYRPKNGVLVLNEAGNWHTLPIAKATQALPGLVVYRFSHGMYYANAERFLEETQQVTQCGPPDVRWLCIHAAAIGDIDYSAGAMLQQLYDELKSRNIRVVFVDVSDDVSAQLNRYKISELLGKDAFYNSLDEVVIAYRKAPPSG
jgi:MFS superfamily sulfate permease-like transporter